MKDSSVATSWPPASGSCPAARVAQTCGQAQRPAVIADDQRLDRADGVGQTPIRPPTVPVGSARLRLTLTAVHQAEDINRLLEVLHRADVRPGSAPGRYRRRSAAGSR
jgi:hypothetical protein